jgi:hypothetical protein
MALFIRRAGTATFFPRRVLCIGKPSDDSIIPKDTPEDTQWIG